MELNNLSAHMQKDILLSQAKEKYKSLTSPDFAFVTKTIAENPNGKLIEQIKKNYSVREITDPNDDTCFAYELSREEERLVLQLSMVGPYAVVLVGNSLVSKEFSQSVEELFRLLENNGISILRKELLEEPVEMNLQNTRPENVKIYQMLFTDTDILPWVAD